MTRPSSNPRLRPTAALVRTPNTNKRARRVRFERVFGVIREEIIAHFAGEGMPQEAVEWYRTNLDYNVPGGKLNRGMSVIDTVEILKSRSLEEDEYFKAAVLGWCVELLQASCLVVDDIMDASITRRAKPCWYRLPSVGMIAIKDCSMSNRAIYQLLKTHFRDEIYYVDLLDLFHETTYHTGMGQLVDLITAPEGNVNLNKFSLARHHTIVIYKTAYYSFYLPVACAMFLNNIPSTNTSLYEQAKSILLPLGEYFQIQDDFLDYSATPEVLGKIGTDIVDNKCSWVINTALSLTSSSNVDSKFTAKERGEMRKVLDDNYGRKDAGAEARVKEVYGRLGIRRAYEEYEERAVRDIKAKIAEIVEVEGALKREVFESFLGKIYRRSQ